MTPKKKRMMWCVVNKNMTIQKIGSEQLFTSKDAAELLLKYNRTGKKLQVLRVTLTASPAGWK